MLLLRVMRLWHHGCILCLKDGPCGTISMNLSEVAFRLIILVGFAGGGGPEPVCPSQTVHKTTTCKGDTWGQLGGI